MDTATTLATTRGGRNEFVKPGGASSIRADVLTRDLHLPRGVERELVFHRDREYTLRGSESRTLATVGAFRVEW